MRSIRASGTMGRAARVALIILAIVAGASTIAPSLLPYDPERIDLDSLRQAPSLQHPLGTDNKGRDVLVRVLAGGRISLAVSFSSALVSLVIGLSAGLIAGYFRGFPDLVVVSIVDLVLSFPSLLLAIGVSVLFPPGTMTVLIALATVGWASFARLVRSQVLVLRTAPYVEAARAMGCGDLRILAMHLLPQCLPLSLVMLGMKIGGFILAEASLSFLGLGAQPPTPTWGSMISTGRIYISSAPWIVIGPGFMITVTALCCYLLGDEARLRYEGSRYSRLSECDAGR